MGITVTQNRTLTLTAPPFVHFPRRATAAAAKGAAAAYHDEEDDPDLAAAIAASLLCMDHDDLGADEGFVCLFFLLPRSFLLFFAVLFVFQVFLFHYKTSALTKSLMLPTEYPRRK
jgi:hypothetical protein